MEIWVNGSTEHVAPGLTVAAYLAAREMPSDHVVVELNGEILAKKHRAEQELKPSDRMEIVTFVGGG